MCTENVYSTVYATSKLKMVCTSKLKTMCTSKLKTMFIKTENDVHIKTENDVHPNWKWCARILPVDLNYET